LQIKWWWCITSVAFNLILGPAKNIASRGSQILAQIIRVVASSIELIWQKSSVSVVLEAPQISVYWIPGATLRPNLDTLNDALYLDHMNTKVQIVGVKGPCVINRLVRLVVMLRRR
jgi:hypothetical protein